MIDEMKPADLRRKWLSEIGKVSELPDEHRYNRDGRYAFNYDSQYEVGFASLIVCKLVDEMVQQLVKAETVSTQHIGRWHLEYAKAGFRAAGMAEIASVLERDPLSAIGAIAELVGVMPPPPVVPMASISSAGFARGH